MSSVVNSFLAAFQRGLARPNRYRVEFQLPSGVVLSGDSTQVNSDAQNGSIQRLQSFFNSNGDINIKCEHATFPQRSMMTYEHKQNSAPFRLPYSSTYDPVTFSFYANSNLDTRDYFDVWQSAVVNLDTNTMNFYDEYVSDVKIVQMDIEGNDTYFATLLEAWPLDVGSIEVGYGQFDTVTLTTVTMAYKYWKPKYSSADAQRSKK